MRIRAIGLVSSENFSRKRNFPVDDPGTSGNVGIPLDAGLQPLRDGRSVVLAIFGTSNWNSILSRHDDRRPAKAGGLNIIVGVRIEFFVARKLRRLLVL